MPKSKKRGPYTPPFTAAQKKAIASAYKQGGTLLGLADQYKCSTSKVRKALGDQKAVMRPRGPQAADPKAKAKKVSKPKAKKVSKPKPKAKKVSKPKADVAPKAVPLKRERKALTEAQRDAKNKADRDRRAAKKQGLKAALAAVAAPAAPEG